MRAILINPRDRTISEIDDDFANPHVLKRYLATGDLGDFIAPLTNGPRIYNFVVSWLDDEGYYRADQSWFMFGSYPHPIAGFCIISGLDMEGRIEPAPNWITPTYLAQHVRWANADYAKTMVPPIVVHSALGIEEFPIDFSTNREMPVYRQPQDKGE